MGFFDRLRKSRSDSATKAVNEKPAAPKKKKDDNSYFLDADASTSFGDLDYMRESKPIRHTFPGTADNPGNKESVIIVDAKDSKIDIKSDGLGDPSTDQGTVRVGSGVPKAVKKTFAQSLSRDDFDQRRRGEGASFGVNSIRAANSGPRRERKAELKNEEEQTSKPQSAWNTKPGSIDPFRAMVRQLNN